jgi:NAD+ kinase
MRYTTFLKNDPDCLVIEKELKKRLTLEYDDENPDLVITIGGDGTTLGAIHKYVDKLDKVKFISFNAGHLGFFSSFNKDEMDAFVEYIEKEEFTYDSLGLIKYEIETTTQGIISGYAVNEVTLVNPRRTLIMDAFVNDNHFEHYRGTGMCISTPVGSTGYNKSLHGAVILPSNDVFQMTEIASINSNLYHTLSSPLILGKKDVIELTTESNRELWITADSISLTFQDFKSIRIKLADKKALLINRNISYLDRVKKNFIL